MRKIIAVWAAKAVTLVGNIIRKKSSSAPGKVALKICPDLIRVLSKGISKGIVVVCGTNGKTTTNNLLNTALIKCGYTTVCNNLGANMLSGVATALTEASNLLGKVSVDYGVFEVDEAYARHLFNYLKPTCMIVTNLFRDQLDRYGEVEATLGLIDEAVNKAEGVTLVLNGDDPVTVQLGENRNAVYYGVSEQVLPQTEKGVEGKFCAKCGGEQKYNFYHYSQLGDYYCESCGYKRPEINFDATEVDLSSSMKFTVNKSVKIDVNYRGFYNIYNILSVYSAMSAMGIKNFDFNKILADYKPQIGRMELMDLGKPVILNLAKNPAGFNQAIQTVMLDKRKKDVIVAINDGETDGRDITWLWDVDFENLADENLNSLTVAGRRRYDLALRFKYNDIKVESVTGNMKGAIQKCLKTDAEVCYVLVNYTVLFSTQETMLEIKKEQGGEK